MLPSTRLRRDASTCLGEKLANSMPSLRGASKRLRNGSDDVQPFLLHRKQNSENFQIAKHISFLKTKRKQFFVRMHLRNLKDKTGFRLWQHGKEQA